MEMNIERAVQYVVRSSGRPCTQCGHAVCGHEALMSLIMGLQNAPRCLRCLASGLDREPEALRDGLLTYVERHECLRAGWQEATRLEAFADGVTPRCFWPLADGTPVARASPETGLAMAPHPGGEPATSAEWDAGDAGCGDLVMDLRMRLASLPPGAILKLTARDPGAPEDLPAWCRLTGHTLVGSEHPVYWIKRKEG